MSSTEYPPIPLELTWRILELVALEAPENAAELALISKDVQRVYGRCLGSP